MSQDRLQILEEAGFTWRDPSRQRKRSDTRQETWDGFISQLADFKLQYGHFMVNKVNKTKQKGSKLGRLDEFCSWVRKQYILYKEGSPCQLTKAKVDQLREMGFWLERGQVNKFVTKKDKMKKLEERDEEHVALPEKLEVPKLEDSSLNVDVTGTDNSGNDGENDGDIEEAAAEGSASEEAKQGPAENEAERKMLYVANEVTV